MMLKIFNWSSCHATGYSQNNTYITKKYTVYIYIYYYILYINIYKVNNKKERLYKHYHYITSCEPLLIQQEWALFKPSLQLHHRALQTIPHTPPFHSWTPSTCLQSVLGEAAQLMKLSKLASDSSQFGWLYAGWPVKSHVTCHVCREPCGKQHATSCNTSESLIEERQMRAIAPILWVSFVSWLNNGR